MAEIKAAVSLKQLAESKTEGIQKTTQFQVDPRKIEIEQGFNAREIDPDHVASFKASILAGSVIPALFVRVEASRIIVVDGHHRLTAYLELIEEGHEIRLIACSQFRGNDAERIAHMLTSAQGKALTPLQMGIQYRRLEDFGWSPAEIAAKIGKSGQHVNDMIALASSDSDVLGMVKKNEVSAAVALTVVKEHGSGAGKVLAEHLEDAKAEGKAKITPKTIKKAREKRDPLMLKQCPFCGLLLAVLGGLDSIRGGYTDVEHAPNDECPLGGMKFVFLDAAKWNRRK